MTRDSDSNHDPDVELIRRYLDGTLDPATAQRVRATYTTTEDGTPVLDAVLAAFHSTPADATDPVDLDRRLHAAQRAAGLSLGSTPRSVPRPRPWVRWGLLAGAVGACVAAVFVTRFATRSHPHTPTSARMYATRDDQRLTLRLDDGTRVTLAPRTTITVDPDFGGHARRVQLVAGQAYFDVASRASTPFIVASGRVMARVLGTRFTVRRFASDQDVLVAVQSGKVAVGRGTPVILTDNMMARVTDSVTAVTTDADVGKFTQWIDGRLVFNNVAVSEVTAVLGQWYGLTFRFADSTLRHRHLTGVFDDHESRREALQNLKIVLGVGMRFDDSVVTLVPDSTRSSTTSPSRRPERTWDHAWTETEVGR